MLRALLLIPFLIVLVAFALSNPQNVQLALWPTDLSLEAPLSIAILVAAGMFFFLGALFVWFGTIAARTRARRAERRAASLEAELRAHHAPSPRAIRPSPAPVRLDLPVVTQVRPATPAIAAPK
jgi:uncharacterized integral membrane protein